MIMRNALGVVIAMLGLFAGQAQAEFVFEAPKPKPVESPQPQEKNTDPGATGEQDVGSTAGVRGATVLPLPGTSPRPLKGPVALKATTVFDARPGETVRSIFQRWCQGQGWTLLWEADFDYQVEAPYSWNDVPLGIAVEGVLRAFAARPGTRRLSARLYEGNNVLVITGNLP